MNNWNSIASNEVIEKTAKALRANGVEVTVVENGKAAHDAVLELIPKGAEVMTMTSVTLSDMGVEKAINESGEYDAVKPKLYSMDRETQGAEMQKLGAAPDWAVGSVHAVTEDGVVVVASNTGSQLPAYAYGSNHVVWVVGAQKLVGTLDEAMKRIYDYVLPLESERARKAYGMDGSNVSKLFILNKEVKPGRITMIIVKESLGY